MYEYKTRHTKPKESNPTKGTVHNFLDNMQQIPRQGRVSGFEANFLKYPDFPNDRSSSIASENCSACSSSIDARRPFASGRSHTSAGAPLQADERLRGRRSAARRRRTLHCTLRTPTASDQSRKAPRLKRSVVASPNVNCNSFSAH